MRLQSHEDCSPILLIHYQPTDKTVAVLRSVEKWWQCFLNLKFGSNKLKLTATKLPHVEVQRKVQTLGQKVLNQDTTKGFLLWIDF